MKKPILKTYIVRVTAQNEREEREFEEQLDRLRKDGLVLTWEKHYMLKHKFGDE